MNVEATAVDFLRAVARGRFRELSVLTAADGDQTGGPTERQAAG